MGRELALDAVETLQIVGTPGIFPFDETLRPASVDTLRRRQPRARVSGEAVTNTRSTSRPLRANEAACDAMTTEPSSAIDARTCLMSIRSSGSPGRTRPPGLVGTTGAARGVGESPEHAIHQRLATLDIRDEGRSEFRPLAGLLDHLVIDEAIPEPIGHRPSTASPSAPVECEIQIAETVPRSYVLRDARSRFTSPGSAGRAPARVPGVGAVRHVGELAHGAAVRVHDEELIQPAGVRVGAADVEDDLRAVG